MTKTMACIKVGLLILRVDNVCHHGCPATLALAVPICWGCPINDDGTHNWQERKESLGSTSLHCSSLEIAHRSREGGRVLIPPRFGLLSFLWLGGRPCQPKARLMQGLAAPEGMANALPQHTLALPLGFPNLASTCLDGLENSSTGFRLIPLEGCLELRSLSLGVSGASCCGAGIF